MHNNQYFPLFQNLIPFKVIAGKVKENSHFHSKENIVLGYHDPYVRDMMDFAVQ